MKYAVRSVKYDYVGVNRVRSGASRPSWRVLDLGICGL